MLHEIPFVFKHIVHLHLLLVIPRHIHQHSHAMQKAHQFGCLALAIHLGLVQILLQLLRQFLPVGIISTLQQCPYQPLIREDIAVLPPQIVCPILRDVCQIVRFCPMGKVGILLGKFFNKGEKAVILIGQKPGVGIQIHFIEGLHLTVQLSHNS